MAEASQSTQYTIERDGEIPLRIGKEGLPSLPPKTVLQVFRETVDRFGDKDALKVFRDGSWNTWTYREYFETCKEVAKGFIKCGLKPFGAVCIIGFNSPEWLFSDLAAIMAGGLASGVYTTNSPEACQYIIDHSKCVVAVVENSHQLGKILQVWDKCPTLKAVVQYTGEVKEEHQRPGVYTWSEFMTFAKDEKDEQLQERMDALTPTKCCTLIYTSGTTGPPKAVMVSHDNVTWTVNALIRTADLNPEDHVISYLPLSHIAAQILDVHGPMACGATVWFAQPDALKGSLLKTLTEVRPTVFLGVPRVWEKMEDKLKAKLNEATGLKATFTKWCMGIGREGGYSLQRGEDTPWGWWLANKAMFEAVKVKMGLDRCKRMLTAAAPISLSTLEFFLSIGIPILEVYGMSECTGPQTVSAPGKHRTGSCGPAMEGTELRIDQPDSDGNGEICYRGRHIFMGYLQQEEKSKEAIDSEGWLHSGDLGKIVDGFLYITGRLKELLITAGGENVAPVPIETKMKEMMPLLSNVMVVGDRQRFLSMFVTLRTKINEDGSPSDELADEVRSILDEIGSTARTVGEAQTDEKISAYIEEGRVKANEFAVSNAQKIQKFRILPVDFSVGGGELTATLKLKRSVVVKQYADLITDIYA